MDSEPDLSAPELTPEDLLRIDDPYFTSDTVALVTGAASGIGRATAVALAHYGLTVVGRISTPRVWTRPPIRSRSSTLTVRSTAWRPT